MVTDICKLIYNEANKKKTQEEKKETRGKGIQNFNQDKNKRTIEKGEFSWKK